MDLTAKKLFYVMCAGLIVGVLSAGYALYWANGQLEARANDINLLNIEKENLNKKIANAKNLEAKLDESQAIIEVANEVLPESKTQENIVGELIAIAAARNITLESINFNGSSTTNSPVTQADKVDGVAGVFSIGLTTSFATSYDNLLQLLRDLEGNKRRFEVTEIDITPNKDENGNVLSYSAQLTILTYVRP